MCYLHINKSWGKIKEWGASERAKIEQAHSTAMNSLILSDSEDMFGSLASIAKDALGEQSRLYRAMFAMQQGFAIAQAGLAMQQAISQGLAKGFLRVWRIWRWR